MNVLLVSKLDFKNHFDTENSAQAFEKLGFLFVELSEAPLISRVAIELWFKAHFLGKLNELHDNKNTYPNPNPKQPGFFKVPS